MEEKCMSTGKVDPNWKDKVIEWQASGKSVRTWCLENHIPITTFYGWKARLEKSSNNKSLINTKALKVKQEFIELKDQQSSGSGLILECEGVKIHLQANFDPFILRRCLDCLRGVSC
jgi:hypothetical protein